MKHLTFFAAAIGASFGSSMLLRPSAFAAGMYSAVGPYLPVVGALYLLASACLLWGQLRGKAAVSRVGAGLATALFAHASALSVPARGWTGTALYGVMAVTALVFALPLRTTPRFTLRFRLLRPVILGCVLPLLALATTLLLRPRIPRCRDPNHPTQRRSLMCLFAKLTVVDFQIF